MKKIKKDLVSKADKIKKKKVSNEKAPKVQNLAPKAKNLADNVKKESQGMKRSQFKMGEKKHMPINPRLKKK